MFNIMKKVIITIVEKIKAVFVIDNFENIDGMSFDFIKEMLKDDYILDRCKFVLISQIQKPGLGWISSTKLTEENYVDLSIAPFSQNQTEALISQYKNLDMSKEFIQHASRVSGGNPAIVEQMIMLFKDANRNGLNNTPSDSLESIMQARLDILKKEDLASYRMLAAMSVLGSKFYPAMLEHFDNCNPKDFERILETLVQRGFINQINNLSFEFKSCMIWKAIVAIVKNDENFEEILNIMYEMLSMYKQSSIALLGYIVQKLNNNDQAFEVWTLLMKQASYIGDIGLYIISQKQALKLIEHKTNIYYQKIKKNIYTRVGKLMEPINHQAAFEYLQNAIMMLDDNEDMEHIELLGYIASASMKSGNYWGAIECAESVLNKIPQNLELERAIVKSREVRPMVKLGNYGQAVNLIDNEIMPIFEKWLSKGKHNMIISMRELYNLWIEIYFDFAEALTFQGDSRSFEIIKLIFEIIDRNKITDAAIICKANLALALANQNLKVALFDADIYGPSIPLMLGYDNVPPSSVDGEIFAPYLECGIKSMSIGCLIEKDAPLIWRGPKACGAIQQLLTETDWGEIDVMVVDMPPGTGDIQITMSQKINFSGAVVVSTPQDVALIDAVKGINLFKAIGVPVLGVIENMSYYICEKCGHRADIFGHAGAKKTADTYNVDFLGEIPLHYDIRVNADAGTPIVQSAPNSPYAKAYEQIAVKIADKLK